MEESSSLDGYSRPPGGELGAAAAPAPAANAAMVM
jgi:hypothetical protein